MKFNNNKMFKNGRSHLTKTHHSSRINKKHYSEINNKFKARKM